MTKPKRADLIATIDRLRSENALLRQRLDAAENPPPPPARQAWWEPAADWLTGRIPKWWW